jgi:hypothetical protein
LSLLQRELNPRLTVAGMLLTMHDARTKLAQDVEREVRTHFPSLVFDTVIPRNVRLGEAPSFGLPVIHHDPHCADRRRTSSSPRRWPPVAEPRRGMGRGLAAILVDRAARRRERRAELRELPVELIAPNPHQPRRHFDEAALVALPSRCASAASSSPSSCARCPAAPTS